MAFIVPRNPLTPHLRLALDVDPAARIVRAADLATFREAEQVIAAARLQAETIVARAQEAREAERQRGHAEGMETARCEAARHLAEQVLRADAYLEGIEDRLVTLVMQAIRKIVASYDEHERVVHSVRNALALVRNQKQITLRLHPAQVDRVKERAADLLADYPGVDLLDVVADARLEADACALECDIGIVEASTEGQLAALEAAFRKTRTARA
jgi:type III secretion protein L